MKNLFSKFGQLNADDFLKGAVVAVLGAVLPIIQGALSNGVLDWKMIGTVALSAFLAYMTKNLFTSSKGEMFTKEK